MRKIQMLDLQTQYSRLKTDIDSAIQNVLESAAFIKGPEVSEFEKGLSKFTGAKFVIGCANGTDALQLALMALDLPRGSEVITPSFSYAALAEVILLMGLVPVFVEVDPNTFLIDCQAIENAITPNTKVIAPVHLYGQTCDMEQIMAIATKNNLFVIEDSAQAIGSKYTFTSGSTAHAGTIGHIGTTSFFPSKNLGCYGDGGAIFTQDEKLAVKLKSIANHGQKVKYQHELIGINSRLDTIQAAVLNVKLSHLLEFEAARNKCADFYDFQLQNAIGVQIPSRVANSTHVFHQYTLTLNSHAKREQLKKHLTANNIPSMIYYPTPLHHQKAYFQDISMPLTESLCQRVISLPIHTEMDAEQLEFICETILNFDL